MPSVKTSTQVPDLLLYSSSPYGGNVLIVRSALLFSVAECALSANAEFAEARAAEAAVNVLIMGIIKIV